MQYFLCKLPEVIQIKDFDLKKKKGLVEQNVKYYTKTYICVLPLSKDNK